MKILNIFWGIDFRFVLLSLEFVYLNEDEATNCRIDLHSDVLLLYCEPLIEECKSSRNCGSGRTRF